MTPKSLVIFVDGASRGNPGPASVGAVLQDESGRNIKTLSIPIGTATNNVAEYFALLAALQEALAMGAKSVRVFTDSELLAKQFSGEYRIKDSTLKLLGILVRQLRGFFKTMALEHIPREKNKLADQAANEALDQGFLL